MNILLDSGAPIIQWRKGVEGDEYVDIVENIKIIDGKLILKEIPDPFTKVRISGYREIPPDLYNNNLTIAPDEFFVSYDNRFVHFNPSEEGKVVSVSYKGRGIVLYSADGIYVNRQGNHSVRSNLQEIIDESLKSVDDAQKAIQDANDTIDEILLSSESTRKIWLPFVEYEADIGTTYPIPQIGWTVQVRQTGITYRFNGTEWVPIESSDTYTYQSSRIKVMQFKISNVLRNGVQKDVFRFPFSGVITEAYALLNTAGTFENEISVEKCSQSNIENSDSWQNIFSNNLFIDANKKSSASSVKQYKILNAQVDKNDHFRINIINTSGDSRDLTVEISIQV